MTNAYEVLFKDSMQPITYFLCLNGIPLIHRRSKIVRKCFKLRRMGQYGNGKVAQRDQIIGGNDNGKKYF